MEPMWFMERVMGSNPSPELGHDRNPKRPLCGLIRALLLAAISLPARGGLRPWTYRLFGLLSVTCLRLGEARNLEIQDVDLKTGVLTIRNAKFGKTRLIPLSEPPRGDGQVLLSRSDSSRPGPEPIAFTHALAFIERLQCRRRQWHIDFCPVFTVYKNSLPSWIRSTPQPTASDIRKPL
jgi:hypothetical protein